MLRLRYPSNKFQKRLLRAVYGHTQAYPYAVQLDPSYRSTDGLNTLVLPATTGTNTAAYGGLSYTANPFTFQGGLVPNTVMVASGTGEFVRVASGLTGELPFGLLGNFVGGNMDELGDQNEVGVWRGFDGVFDLLLPGFDGVGITASTLATALATNHAPAPLIVGNNGLLTIAGSALASTDSLTVGRVIQLNSAGNVLRVDLKL